MRRFTRFILVLSLLAALLPVQGALAGNPPVDPVCANVAAQLGAKAESGVLDGAIYCIIIPGKNAWNRDVVMFAHGYVDERQPLGIPWDTQLITAQNNLPALVLNLGYAFATTSYSTNGLAVQQGVNDIVRLAQYLRASNKRVHRIFLTGASEGGLVTTLAVERNPQEFAGGLATCGPIGSFQYQVQYWGDFRVAFDSFFPTALAVPPAPLGPSTPIYIDPFVVLNWEAIRDSYIAGLLSANPLSVQALLAQTKVPIDPANPVDTTAESIFGLLYYNVEATNNGRTTLIPGANIVPPSLEGNPYINPMYIPSEFPYSPYDDGILQGDGVAEAMLAYETTADLNRQLVVMHTTGDPIIPFNHTLLYAEKALKSHSLLDLTIIPINRYGHCAFKPAEIVFGFYTMVLRSTLLPFSAEQIQHALPDNKSQEAFRKLKENYPEK